MVGSIKVDLKIFINIPVIKLDMGLWEFVYYYASKFTFHIFFYVHISIYMYYIIFLNKMNYKARDWNLEQGNFLLKEKVS